MSQRPPVLSQMSSYAHLCDRYPQLAAAVAVWLEKPHVLNRKLFGARLLMSSGDFTIRIVYPKLFTEIDPFTEEIRFDSRGYHFASKHASYSVVIVGGSPKVTCVDVKSLEIFSPQWFHECLEARLCHWASMSLDHSPPSLNLVNYENYQKVYARLKTCYWDDLRASWCEKTDPEKFIHEDFGIAAYLICIWSSLKKDVYFVDIGCGNGLLVYLLISEGFHGIGVDIKRRGMWGQYPARIAAALREETLDPSTHPGFPQATFLIGNHSDELTPWLPVLATKSNSECQVFTVPCCPFSLYQKFDAGQYTQQLRDGVYQQFTDYRQRYSPTFTTESAEEPNLIAEGGFWRGRYRHYIHYLKDVFRICGFEPELDILRIPSTKRRLGNVNKLLELESHPCRSRGCDDSSNTATKFVPRPSDDGRQMPNLSIANRDLICLRVFERVLELKPNVQHLRDLGLTVSEDRRLQTLDQRWWNPGGQLSLSEASAMLTPDMRQELKQVMGGLQTLLRNHHQAFLVTKNAITLRFDANRLVHSTREGEKTREPAAHAGELFKTKRCWMETNHPDGCPYPPEICNFAHSFENLRLPPTDFMSKKTRRK